MHPISKLRASNRVEGTSVGKRLPGFSMIEMVAVMALMALLAGLVVPVFRGGTGKADLQAIALETSALLRETRLGAISSGEEAIFYLDISNRRMASSARSGVQINVPRDVEIIHEVSSRCRQQGGVIEVIFREDGRSCGSQISLSIAGYAAIVQTNWLIGKTSLRFETR